MRCPICGAEVTNAATGICEPCAEGRIVVGEMGGNVLTVPRVNLGHWLDEIHAEQEAEALACQRSYEYASGWVA